MDNITFNNINHLFSTSRISPYFQTGDSPREVLNKYHLNIMLSEAMVPTLHYLEVCLRNRIDHLFCKLYGLNWLIQIPKNLPITVEDIKRIDKIKARIKREYKREPAHGDILSQMAFGFWCSFFHRKYDPIIWHRKNSINSVFPNLPRFNRKRSYIEKKILIIKDVRNRIAHHEPIWNMVISIEEVHRMCIEIINAISIEASSQLQMIDRFPKVNKDTIFLLSQINKSKV